MPTLKRIIRTRAAEGLRRRRVARCPLSRPVEIAEADERLEVKRVWRGDTLDVGARGMGIRSDLDVPVGTTLWVRVLGDRPRLVLGEVRRCDERDAGATIGIEYRSFERLARERGVLATKSTEPEADTLRPTITTDLSRRGTAA